jgi:glycerol-3-phosphate acyltransferase PlsY
MDTPFLVVALTFAGYLVGSIPFGIVASKALGTPDPRATGSRNVGFTNVLRVGGAKAGILTLAGDMGKGWLVAWLAGQWLTGEVSILMVAMASVLGHLYSVFLAFHGGKGVATALGVVTGIAPAIGFSMVAIWLMTVWLWRYSSGGALAAFGVFPVFSLVFHQSHMFFVFACVVTALICVRHRDNIARLLSGTESRIGQATKF